MKDILINDKITEDNYHEFVEQIVNIFRISSLDKSILFSLKIEKADCNIDLSILRNDGNKQEYERVTIDSNEPFFYDFLHFLVKSIREHLEIIKEDYVNLDDDYFVAYRMITKFNDLITFDGLTEDQAKDLLKKETPEVKLSVSNTTGGSNIIGFIFMIVALVISITAIIFLVK